MKSFWNFILSRSKQIQTLVYVMFVFIFCAISLVNHYFFRTNAYDLGIFNHAMYNYAHFSFNQATLLLGFVEINNILADHFSLLQIVFAPLYYIFGTYTLLLVQIAFIFIGSWGIKRYISLFVNDVWTPFLSQVHFFVSFGVIAALGFDYHDSVLAACLFPHLLYYAQVKNVRSVLVLSILMLLTRVELSIWMLFISMALFIQFRESKVMKKVMLGVGLFSLFYFVSVIKLIIPEISNDGYTQFNFSVLGEDVGEALTFSIINPFQTLSYIFTDQFNGPPENFYIKRDFFIAFLISGGFLLILRPIFLIMLFPVIAQRMLNDSILKWGISGHYSIEAVSILSIAVFHVIASVKDDKKRYLAAVALIFSSVLVTKYYWSHRYPDWSDTTPENFTSKWHYDREFDVSRVHEILKEIPEDAIVSAQNNLVPHLTSRQRIYLFPYVSDANYIVLNEKCNVYPMIWEHYWETLDSLKADENWELIISEEFTHVFKKSGE